MQIHNVCNILELEAGKLGVVVVLDHTDDFGRFVQLEDGTNRVVVSQYDEVVAFKAQTRVQARL